MRAWRIGAVCGAGLVTLLGACALAFGPLVRSRVAREAAGRGVVVEYDSAVPHVGSVELRGVRIGLAGTQRLGARFDSVLVRLWFPLHIAGIEVEGGEVTATGDADAIGAAVSEWRSKRPPPDDRGAAAARTPARLEGVAITWRGDDGSTVGSGHGLSLLRDADLQVGAESVDGSLGGLRVAAAGARIVMGLDGALHDAHLHGLQLSWTPSAEDSPRPARPEDEPPPAPLPATAATAAANQVQVPITRRAGKRREDPSARTALTPATIATDDPAAPATPLLALPDLGALRDRATAVAKRLATRLPEGAAVDVDGLSFAIAGKRPLTLGPGPVRIVHAPGSVEIDFRSPSADADATGAGTAASANGAASSLGTPARAAANSARSSTALTFHAAVPLEGGSMYVTFSGGPLSLAALGVRDGAAGLLETNRTLLEADGRVVLDADARELAFDGGVHIEDLSLQDARLAADPVRHLELGARARGVLTTDGLLKLEEGSLDVGAIKLRAHGDIRQDPHDRQHATASLSFDVPVAACQAMLSSVPAALLPTVGAAHMTGTFGATGSVSFDTQRLDDLKLDYHVDDGCRLDAVPRDLAPERFSHGFLHRVYGPDGEVREEETGPGTPRWSDLEAISPFLQVAVLTTEDGGFPRHHGFNHNAIKNAIIANLKARRFVRGASTITMQLAKNLFLTRDKTLSRKLEEVILTDYLEQVFQKDQMMELYLNIIEFGPDVYGVSEAAEHYFGLRPDELDLAESLFLSSIMPSPIRYHKMYDRGALPDGWAHHLQTLMRIAQKAGNITPAELEEGMKETVVFHKEGTPRPPPRQPVTAAHFRGADSPDTDWDYVQ